MKQLAVLGAGSWGTALAIALASRFDSIRLWARDSAQAAELQTHRENARYLPGFRLPERVAVESDVASVVSGTQTLLLAIPAAQVRLALEAVRPHLGEDSSIVSATKGIEEDSLCRVSEIARSVFATIPGTRVAVLSGPTFAKEIAAGEPAAVVIAADDLQFSEAVQRLFSTSTLRLYTSTDVIGVETGAAIKNVIAIGAGICSGLGLGSNSIAALVTRGLAECTRLAVALGGNARTLSGLAGLGDLVLTATGDLSRNRFVGVQLGRGRSLEEILAGMTSVAEGVGTCRAAYQLGMSRRLDLPIVNKVYEILYGCKDPRQAIRELMERPLTSE